MNSLPPSVATTLGADDGVTTRPPRCATPSECDELQRFPRALLKVVAMAAAPDGSVYVGDLNLIRRVYPDGRVATVMDLG